MELSSSVMIMNLDPDNRHLLLTGTYHEVAILDFNSAIAVCMPFKSN